jgi:peptidyl-prolyl cis-trans isomerase B (cyclophilin B)
MSLAPFVMALTAAAATPGASASLAAQPMVLPRVQFVIEGRGSFVMEVRKDQAPKLAAHFLDLVDRGFYTGLLIHRKVKDFVIQSGDPASRKVSTKDAVARPGEMGGTKGLGEGGSGKEIPYEINDLVHDRFTVGMALSSPMSDTGDSQFFINLKNNHRLNGLYCVFAKVVEGQEVIPLIERGDRITLCRRAPRL